MREKMIKEAKKRRKTTKRSMFGFFTSQSSTMIGDPYMDSSKREQRWERGNGAMVRGVKAKGHGSFQKKSTAFSLGEPYIDPGKLRRNWQKKLDKKRLPDHGAFSGGTSRMSQSLDQTFMKTRFQSPYDADEESDVLSAKIKQQLAKRRNNRPKFAGFVKPNMLTAAPPAGGSGVHGRLIPVFDKALKKHTKYIESPFSAPRMLRTAERLVHEKTLDRLHESKRFAGRVRKQDHFVKNLDTYGIGENPDGTAIVEPVYRDQPKQKPLLDKEGQPMAPWIPSNPAKRGKDLDKKMLFQKLPEHIPDGYDGALQKTRQSLELDSTLNQSIHEKAWNPNGTHTFTGKGSASIMDNVVASKHKVLRKR